MNKFFIKKHLLVLAIIVIPGIGEASLSWSNPELIGLGVIFSSPKISINDSNEAMAMWIGNTNGNDVIQASYYSTTWNAPVTCSKGRNNLSNPRIALNNNREALAVWAQEKAEKDTIQAAFSSNGIWSAPVTLFTATTLPTYITYLEMAFNNAGDGIVVWVSNLNENRIQAAIYSDGKWSRSKFLSENLGDGAHENIQVAMNDSGVTIVSWSVYEDSNLIKAVVGKKGCEWSKPFTISSSMTGKMIPQFSLNDKGEAILVWSNIDNLEFSTYSGNKWSKPKFLASTNAIDGNILVSLNNNSNAIVAWPDFNKATRLKEMKAVRKFNGVWSSPITVSEEGFNCISNQIILNDLEQAVLAYYGLEPLTDDDINHFSPSVSHSLVVGFSNEKWEATKEIFAIDKKSPDGSNRVVFDMTFNNLGQVLLIGEVPGTDPETTFNMINVIRGNF